MVSSDQADFSNMKVLVVDDDQSSLKSCQVVLYDLGFTKIDLASDGVEAGELIANKTYDLVILDWKLPKIGGAGLISRLRARSGYEFVPVIVSSGMLKTKDFTLLEELHFTCMIEKPFKVNLFQFKLKDLLSQIAHFKSKLPIWQELSKEIEAGPSDGVWRRLDTLLAEQSKPVPFAMAVFREIENWENPLEKLKMLEMGLKHAPEALPLLTEQAKLLLQMGRLKEAVVVLEKAQEIAPLDVNRLCLLGNIEMQEIEPGKAAESFRAALRIDPQHEEAQAGKLLAKNTADYLTRSDVTRIPDNFASLLNAIGISIVRQKNYEEGISHYESAMKFVSDPERQAKLAFNLGLGYLRWNKPDEAKVWFDKSFTLSKGRYEKARVQAEKIEKNVVIESEIPSAIKNLEVQVSQGDSLAFVDFSEDDDLAFESLVHKKAE